MNGRQLLYSGHVQGVCFRETVRQIASTYRVAGWVRNLPDARVELQASGENNELNAFLDAIRNRFAVDDPPGRGE